MPWVESDWKFGKNYRSISSSLTSATHEDDVLGLVDQQHHQTQWLWSLRWCFRPWHCSLVGRRCQKWRVSKCYHCTGQRGAAAACSPHPPDWSHHVTSHAHLPGRGEDSPANKHRPLLCIGTKESAPVKQAKTLPDITVLTDPTAEAHAHTKWFLLVLLVSLLLLSLGWNAASLCCCNLQRLGFLVVKVSILTHLLAMVCTAVLFCFINWLVETK